MNKKCFISLFNHRPTQLPISDEGNVTSAVYFTPDTEQTEKAALSKVGVDSGKPVSNIQVEYCN